MRRPANAGGLHSSKPARGGGQCRKQRSDPEHEGPARSRRFWYTTSRPTVFRRREASRRDRQPDGGAMPRPRRRSQPVSVLERLTSALVAGRGSDAGDTRRLYKQRHVQCACRTSSRQASPLLLPDLQYSYAWLRRRTVLIASASGDARSRISTMRSSGRITRST